LDWRNIPSLASLRAFETAARHGSFSAAARELNVTHAAIVQHVKALEEFTAKSLMVRQGNGMTLTADGKIMATALTEGFQTVQSGIEQIMRDGRDRPLNVSVTPLFAENWLMPRLGDFWRNHPEVKLALLPSIENVDLRRDNIDVAIRYGRGTWKGLKSTLLTEANFTVVAAPEFIKDKKIDSFEDLLDQPWLLENAQAEQLRWVQAQGLDLEKANITWFPTSTLLQTAARNGYGVAMLPTVVISDDLETERLVSIYCGAQEHLGYYLVTQTDLHSINLNLFLRWIKGAV